MVSTPFRSIFDHQNIKMCLLDAAGVLYNHDSGLLSGVVSTIKWLQSKGVLVGLLTNNSMQSPLHIQKWLKNYGIELDLDAIFTSGLSVIYDPRLVSQIDDKRVYMVGRDSSIPYFEQAGAADITDQIETADIVAIMSHNGPGQPDELARLARVIHQQSLPVVCCNTDRYIRMGDRRYEVAGYFAQQLKRDHKVPIQWYGKPMRSFYMMVARLLKERYALAYDHHILYVDDLIANIRGSKQAGTITTAHAWGSGLDAQASEVQSAYCDYSIESIA